MLLFLGSSKTVMAWVSVLRRDIAAFIGHDAVILQDLLEGRDAWLGVRLLHHGWETLLGAPFNMWFGILYEV